jgi:predicted DNA-binding transcriptional regulator YafY
MRADRLLSILMYLQTRGRTTTARLADEFEVSRRTIIRDLYALRVAGFPVYTERGPHGGCYLHEEYRNTLTQLTTDEMGALFLSSREEPLRDLGLSDPLRAALLKLTAALPASRQAEKRRVSERILLDSTARPGRKEPAEHLATLHQAAMENRWVLVTLRRPFGVLSERRIALHGLVAKGGGWFLVWAAEDGRCRVDRLSAVRAAELQEARFERVQGYQLERFWTEWRDRQARDRPVFGVRLRVREDAMEYVEDALSLRQGVFYGVPKASETWVTIDVAFTSLEDARRAILSLGGAVEVISPNALRRSVEDFAEQIRAVYHTTDSVDVAGDGP